MPFKKIADKCNNFFKLSSDIRVSKISIIKSDDPFLIKLNSLNNFDDRIAFAKKKHALIGEGSSRVVFKLSEDSVIKIAKNEKGVSQNLEESKPQMQRDCTNRILLSDTHGNWIVVRLAKRISKNRFKELTGFDFDSFSNLLFYKFNNEASGWKDSKNYNDIMSSDLFECLTSWIIECDPQIGDIIKIDSWGEVDSKPVLMDYGLSKKIYRDYYE